MKRRFGRSMGTFSDRMEAAGHSRPISRGEASLDLNSERNSERNRGLNRRRLPGSVGWRLLLCFFLMGCLAETPPSQAETELTEVEDVAGPDWVQVTGQAAWQPRDSSGEVVFRDRMWLLGGWFDSYSAPPRDVWSSRDGRTWEQVTHQAPWKHSDLPMTITFRDRMWLMGGWYNGRLPGHEASREVWASSDGAKWEQVTAQAAWSARLAAGIVVHRDRLWILGGIENYYFGDSTSLKNDVWSSADGRTWRQETAAAPWAPRAYHGAVVHDGKIWVLGGGNYVPEYQAHHDVWYSEDGIHWEEATGNAPWHPRLWFSALTYRDHLWVLGGWSNEPSRNWGDVWFSRDGRKWQRLVSEKTWKERHEHSAYVFQDKIWVAGGHAMPLNSEVWSLQLPDPWPPADATP
jgi:hypothetical protein